MQWQCEDDTINMLSGILDNIYSDPEYHKIKPTEKICDDRSRKNVSVVYIKRNIFISNSYEFFGLSDKNRK